ncbi:hypothetical protein AB685_12150 [Bacillus sp. LL01]|uniref:hypothetical protein n=1 Tax=Bacillus sp. LL01 TaxID=1665556 RepID=UPI00064CE1A6|nr:hypothetical protein [Bacillus sp. LL01]KMJ58622.1 hypothetical protein AB685_12150 [Bacillus sp. LL01]
MNIWQLIQSKVPESMLGKTSIDIQAKTLGRVFQAMVTEQLNGALFSIQKGSVSSQATIHGKVEVGKEYIFEVKKGPAGVFLTPTDKMSAVNRLLPSPKEKNTAETPTSRPLQTSPPLQTTQERIQAMVTTKGDSIPAAAVKELVGMIDRLPASEKETAMEIVKVLVHRTGITSAPEKLQMMLSGFSDKETVLQSLSKVEASIQKDTLPTPVQQKLLEIIHQMQQPQTLHTKDEALQFIRQAVSLIGLDFEKSLSDLIRQGQPLSEGKLEQLKPLLMNYLQQVDSPEEKSAITQLISRLTGFQLFSREEGNLHHLFLPIPINTHDEAKEWYVHISSKKKDEMLDPDYCRVVLLLDLPVFSSVMVDVLVQQKVVSLSLHHSYPGMDPLIQRSASLLKKSLSVKGFTLSAVKAECNLQEESKRIPLDFIRAILTPIEKGFDIKI